MTQPQTTPERFLYIVFARGNPPREAKVQRIAWDPSFDGTHASVAILRAASLAIRAAGPDWQFICAHDPEANARLFPATAGATAYSLALASGAAPETILHSLSSEPATSSPEEA